MVTQGRQTLGITDLPETAASAAIESLTHDGVLRDSQVQIGQPIPPVEFAHPVLFDYAVALLGLGDPSQRDSLAVRLDENPNLVITVRPSLYYRLAAIWRNDASRESFWTLALRLMSRSAGHPLAALAAGRVAAVEIEQLADCEPLGAACMGARSDPSGRWTTTDAYELAFLVAAASSRATAGQEAPISLSMMAANLAAAARGDDNVDLALLAVQLPQRAINRTSDSAAPHDVHLGPAAVDCMAVAVADRADPRRARLAELSGRLLARVAAEDPTSVAATIQLVCQPEFIDAWGESHLRSLIDQLPRITRAAPDLGVTIGACVWEFQDTRDEPTRMGDSEIFNLTSNRRQDLDGARYQVGQNFAAILDADLGAATALLVRAVDASGTTYADPVWQFAEPPRPRLADSLRYSSGHHALLPMTQAWVDRLLHYADAAAGAADSDASIDRAGTQQAVNYVIQNLRHAEVWQRLLLRASLAPEANLARELLPALLSPNLFAYPTTWLQAAQVAVRLSASLDDGDHASLERTILRLAEPNPSGDDGTGRLDRLNARCTQIIGTLAQDALRTDEAQARWEAAHQAADFEPVPAPEEDQLGGVEVEWSAPPAEPGSVADVRNQVSQAIEQSKDQNADADRTEAQLKDLWTRLKPYSLADAADETDDGGEDSSYDVALRLAEHLAGASVCAPSTPLGDEVYAALQRAMPSASGPSPLDNVGELWAMGPGPAWSSTTTMSALEGIVKLVCRKDWRDQHYQQLTTLVTPFLDSPNPAYRFLASWALPALYPEVDALLDELSHRLAREPDDHVTAHLLRHLGHVARSLPERVDRVLQDLSSNPRWAMITSDTAGDELQRNDSRSGLAVQLLATLAVLHATDYADSTVRTWWANPLQHPNRVGRTAVWWRDALNSAEASLRHVQARAFEIIGSNLSQLGQAWAAIGSPPGPADDAARERASRALRVAEGVAQQLYFASGAFDKQSSAPPTPRGDSNEFWVLAHPLLTRLADVHHPTVTQHIVQTIDHLSACEPRQALMLAAQAVLGDRAYAREPLGLDVALNLAKRYLTEHGELLRTDTDSLTAVRSLLEAFVRVGWDRAMDLAEELDELFR
jgi:hypothetical protein